VDITIHLGDREHHIQGPDHVVRLGIHRVLTVDHRIRGRTLLGIMHDRIRTKTLDRVEGELSIAQVSDKEFELVAGDIAPRLYPVTQRLDGHQALQAQLVVVGTAGEVVQHGNIVAPVREVQRSRPAEVTVTAENENPHRVASCRAEWMHLPIR
jgi:hypothetical protein